MTSHDNKLSSDATFDDNDDRKCLTPSPHLGVYVWSVVMENNECMCVKDTVAIPAGVCSEGQVGMTRGQVPSYKVSRGAYDHTTATFLDDGELCKSTRTTRESSMIAVPAKLTPQEQTPLGVLFKHKGQFLEEDQTLMTNLTWTQNLLKSTDSVTPLESCGHRANLETIVVFTGTHHQQG